MAREVIWSPLAENDLISIIEYLVKNWDQKVIDGFIEITFTSVSLLAINPKQFPFLNKNKKIRRCVLTKHSTLYYRERKNCVDILRIYDNRQNPKKVVF